MGTVFLHLPGSLQKGHNLAQFTHSENTADLQTFYRAADITDTSEGDTSLLPDPAKRVGGLRLSTLNFPEGRDGDKFRTFLFGSHGCGMFC